MDSHSIRVAVEHIDQQWRSTRHRQSLISELTALTLEARLPDGDQPVDLQLIKRIEQLRSQIWLSSEGR